MIEINEIKQRDDERQIAFFTLDGQEFSCGNVPIGLDTNTKILKYLNGREDEFKLLILRKQYPESDHKRFFKDDISELKAMQEWIAKGHRNKIQIGLTKTGKPKYGYEVVEKQELEYRHPKWIGLMVKIDASSVDNKTKELLKEIIKE